MESDRGPLPDSKVAREGGASMQLAGDGSPGSRNSKYRGLVTCLGVRRDSVTGVNGKRTVSLGQLEQCGWYNEESIVSSTGRHWSF